MLRGGIDSWGFRWNFPSLQVRAQELTYNGRAFNEFVVESSAAYVSQVGRMTRRECVIIGHCVKLTVPMLVLQMDLHFAELTVRETFDFSCRCQSTGYRRGASDIQELQFAACSM